MSVKNSTRRERGGGAGAPGSAEGSIVIGVRAVISAAKNAGGGLRPVQ
jgi:hypothetical protein